MGAFEYVALDQAGKESKGHIEGDTPKHVRQILRERSLLPVAVTEVAHKEAHRQRSFSLRSGISAADLAVITRQLASLAQSGLPLEEALLAVAQQNDQPRTKSIVLGVRSKVMEGHTLADGLGEFPQAFPDLYRSTVAAGEQSGKGRSLSVDTGDVDQFDDLAVSVDVDRRVRLAENDDRRLPIDLAQNVLVLATASTPAVDPCA